MKPLTKAIWIVFFAIAMGYLESAVVVYLRELYYPEGFNFPLKAMSDEVVFTELYRELATLIMILAVSVLAAEYWLHRYAWFLVVFSVWDITYYVFLKVLINWPSSLVTTDILFLLPSIWTGPVIAPVINSVVMILLAYTILSKSKNAEPLVCLTPLVWALLITGSLIVLIAYMKDFGTYLISYKQSFPSTTISNDQTILVLSTKFIPRTFDWLLFSAGVCMHIAAVVLVGIRKRKAYKD